MGNGKEWKSFFFLFVFQILEQQQTPSTKELFPVARALLCYFNLVIHASAINN